MRMTQQQDHLARDASRTLLADISAICKVPDFDLISALRQPDRA